MNISNLKALAKLALGQTSDKWRANQALWEWFRSNPMAVIEVIAAAAAVRRSPGGLSHSRLYKALDELPEIPQEDIA